MRLSNAFLDVEISTAGAEITSLINLINNDQLLWHGDKTYWGGRNPILFPIVGSTYDKQLHINGQSYSIGNHGVARHMEFNVVQHDNLHLILRTTSNEWSLKQYPFEFALQVTYKLKERNLQIDYLITNHSTAVMPFTFGLHPAFALREADEEQAKVKWPLKENLQQIKLDASMTGIMEIQSLSIKKPDFMNDNTLIFQGMMSDYLEFFNGKSTIEVGIAGFPYLAFWRANQAPFICIEPWLSIPDLAFNPVDFSERAGSLWLNSQQSYQCSYYIGVK